MVPDPVKVVDYNRFLYTRGNPLSYTDPSGQCPKPDGDYARANIICVAGFIPTETSEAFPGLLYFMSDNRGFSSNSAKDASRFWIWIDADTGQKLDAHVHPTQEATGKNGEPKDEAWQARLKRIIWKDWIMGSSFLESSKLADGGIVLEYMAVCSHPICNNLFAAQGLVVFQPNDHGSFDSFGLVDHFPSLEAYHWKGGQLQSDNLFQIQSFSKKELEVGHANTLSSLGMAWPISFEARSHGLEQERLKVYGALRIYPLFHR